MLTTTTTVRCSVLLRAFFWNLGVREGQIRGQLKPPPPKKKKEIGAEVRNCIWRLWWICVKVMAMTTCLTLIHERPRACIHIQRNKDNMTFCELSHVPGPWIKIGGPCVSSAICHSAGLGCVRGSSTVARRTIEPDFWPSPPCWKMVPARLLKLRLCVAQERSQTMCGSPGTPFTCVSRYFSHWM